MPALQFDDRVEEDRLGHGVHPKHRVYSEMDVFLRRVGNWCDGYLDVGKPLFEQRDDSFDLAQKLISVGGRFHAQE